MTSGNLHQRKPTSRTAISEAQKEEICNYARSHPNDSNSMILAWARQKFRPDFPQSTLSTMLSKHGIITRKAGGRGRPPIGSVAAPNSSTASTSTNISATSPKYNVQSSPEDPSSPEFSVRTGLKYKDLQRLAGARFRGRSSVYKQEETALLEEIYDTLSLGQTRITLLWLRERTCDLLVAKNPKFQRKYLCQFLEQLFAKYYLTSVIGQHLKSKSDSFTYECMLQKLALKFPGLKYAPVPDLDGSPVVGSETESVASLSPVEPILPDVQDFNLEYLMANSEVQTIQDVQDVHDLSDGSDGSDLSDHPYPMSDDSMLTFLNDTISIEVQDCDSPCHIPIGTNAEVLDFMQPYSESDSFLVDYPLAFRDVHDTGSGFRGATLGATFGATGHGDFDAFTPAFESIQFESPSTVRSLFSLY